MEFKLLEKWMQDYEDNRYNQITKTQNLMNKWKEEKKKQKTLDVNYPSYNKDSVPVIIPEMKQHCCATISPNWKRVTEQATVRDRNAEGIKYKVVETTVIIDQIEVNGKLYEDYVTGGDYYRMQQKYNGLEKLLSDNQCSMSDYTWLLIIRTDTEIHNKAHKDMLNQKKAIEAKIRKICGDEFTHIDDTTGDLYVRGINGRTAHIWAITAGGYNQDIIVNERHGQCLHIRILVKEVK